MNLCRTGSVSLVVEAKIIQSFIILEEFLTVEEIKEGLSNGTYYTSIDYSNQNNKEYIYRLSDENEFVKVAAITSQVAEGDVAVYCG